jgi:hypothetical protein
MKRFKALQIFLAFMMLILSVVIAGCGSNGQTGHWLPARTLTSITVTPVTASVPVSGNQQFTAIATYSDGTSIDVTVASAWTSSIPGNASVNAATGWATGILASTSSVITATYGGLSGSATLNVNAATSISFKVIPATASIPVTGTQQYTAIETFSDGTTQDRTLTSTWTASGTHATISNTSPTIGVATGVSVGTSTITATYALSPHSPATATLTVTAATSVSFVVTPATASIPITGTQQYTAIETFSDGSTFDRTAVSTWTAVDISPGSGVATILGTGVATGASIGQSTITAAYGVYTGAVGLANRTAVLTVTAATPVSLIVTPATASVVVGGTQPYAAIEIFSDGSNVDRTAVSTWSTTAGTGTATILSTGVATGQSIGTVTINASYGGYTPTAMLTVTAPNSGPAGAVDLKSATTYGLIAYDAITNSAGPSHIYGDVALTEPGPGGTIASVTGPGFNDAGSAPNLTSSIVTDSNGVTPGMVTAADNGSPANIAALPQLLTDLEGVYSDLIARAAPATSLTTPALALGQNGGTFAPGQDLSGYVLSPGIFTTSGTYGLSNTLGPLVLDAGGNPDAVFIIRSTSGASGFTSTTGSVILRNGAQAQNVYWVVAHNITIGNNTFFQGTIVAGNAITLNQFVNVQGRILAGALGLVSGALTLTNTNVITVPTP